MSWRFPTTIVLAVMLLDAGVSSAPRREAALPVIRGKGYRGVIFPKAPPDFVSEGSWRPSVADVALLEGLLADAMKNTLDDSRPGRDILGGPGFLPEKDWLKLRTYHKEEIAEILPRLGWYRRQYAGIGRGNRRAIVVNFFPGEDRNDYLASWRSEWISVKGGGTSYWTVRFNVKERTFDEFYANASK